VFGADNGRSFVGNSKYQYLYVDDYQDVRNIWISKSPDVIDSLNTEGYEAYASDSLKGIYFTLRSKYVFGTHGIDVPWWATGGSDIVQFWHGNPLKIGGWENRNAENFTTLTKLMFQRIYWNWDYLVVTTKNKPGELLREWFRMGEEETIVTGYPRNDALFNRIEGENIGTAEETKEKINDMDDSETIFCYAPTFRQGFGNKQGTKISEMDLDYESLNSLLRENNSYLFIKMHPHESGEIEVSNHDRLIMSEDESDIYPLLRHTDCLITDYSSIFSDYLLLNKPIIFFPYDYKKYTSSRDLCFEYDRVTPGPKATTQDELHNYITTVTDGKIQYDDAQRRVCSLYHDFYDGNSAKRVYEYLK
jgi:CDP-glycerol glycerophosphotransferase (TagB/SpsB family)